jgi:hypothetical protein
MPGAALGGLIIFLLIVGIILWMFPIDATIRKLVIGAVLIVSLIWLAGALGWISMPNLR